MKRGRRRQKQAHILEEGAPHTNFFAARLMKLLLHPRRPRCRLQRSRSSCKGFYSFVIHQLLFKLWFCIDAFLVLRGLTNCNTKIRAVLQSVCSYTSDVVDSATPTLLDWGHAMGQYKATNQTTADVQRSRSPCS